MTNAVFTARNATLLSLGTVEAPLVVTSEWIDQQLAETYAACGVRPGLLETVAGIAARRWWPEETTFDQVAAEAGRVALSNAGVRPEDIDVLISTSVCKHHLEPSLASSVHHQLGLSPAAMNFDLANACLGFINAMWLASQLIDSGQVRYVLIVDGEGSRHTQEETIRRLQQPGTTAEDIFDEFASLTLGSGAVAAVIGPATEGGHRIIGGVSQAATQHHELCIGTLDRMTTDTRGLLENGIELAVNCFTQAEQHERWLNNVDWYVLHQVSKVHTDKVCQQLGINPDKVPVSYPMLGNVGPAAIPITMANNQHLFSAGEHILCMGIGSGLNVSFVELQW
ncbi:MAG: 3-oxoacyl-ACP synthase III [Ilumatobacteraceae bacterium]